LTPRESSEALLFEVSPEEEEGKKKKRASRKPVPPRPAPASGADPARQHVGYLASIDGHVACDRCGLTIVDLVEIRKVDGQTKWLVSCGWNCLHSWLIDPVPGVLDKQDKSQEPESLRVRGGRFDGLTFDEIARGGDRWFIKLTAGKSRRTFLAAAAAEWLEKNP
jgi:hypothetical protein